jgi:Flp pilus assembly protein TadG
MSRRLFTNARGVAATEFALVLPFLALLYLGGYQLADAISAYRKVTLATRTVADLTSQYTSLTDTDLDAILNASQQVMAPYKIANAKLTVSQVSTDGSGNTKVAWSRGLPTSEALTVGSTYTLPTTIKQNNTSLIIASIRYNYVPNVSAMIGTLPMRDDIIMSPRASTSVKKVQ